eukprot:TRINITY_DN8564_c0_g2_i1.p1 TRINITY_DN8564_c0_g2~~TRINITY_DN8564_c0_g2_i1.p1  ORF type:complete len:366 (-),score=49.09 TRINITY_DN8564_c0_g2_i1:125-1084(-)
MPLEEINELLFEHAIASSVLSLTQQQSEENTQGQTDNANSQVNLLQQIVQEQDLTDMRIPEVEQAVEAGQISERNESFENLESLLSPQTQGSSLFEVSGSPFVSGAFEDVQQQLFNSDLCESLQQQDENPESPSVLSSVVQISIKEHQADSEQLAGENEVCNLPGSSIVKSVEDQVDSDNFQDAICHEEAAQTEDVEFDLYDPPEAVIVELPDEVHVLGLLVGPNDNIVAEIVCVDEEEATQLCPDITFVRDERDQAVQIFINRADKNVLAQIQDGDAQIQQGCSSSGNDDYLERLRRQDEEFKARLELADRVVMRNYE